MTSKAYTAQAVQAEAERLFREYQDIGAIPRHWRFSQLDEEGTTVLTDLAKARIWRGLVPGLSATEAHFNQTGDGDELC